jgi:DNA adenine methylase
VLTEAQFSDAQTNLFQGAMSSAATATRIHRQSELFPTDSQDSKAKPFLKWAGGKTRLLPVLRTLLARQTFRRYYEPFLGGAALFFDIGPRAAVLNDRNPELIFCYEIVRDHPTELFTTLKRMKVNEEEFYRIRSLNPENLAPVERAARFIYLNKTCYNGLYRVNKKGQFNTPYGRNDKVSLADEDNLYRASRILRNALLMSDDYSSVVKDAGKDDFVYLDPPYLPVGKYADFKRYTKETFFEDDHRKLAETFRELSGRGCLVLLSNSYHEEIAKLYSGFYRKEVEMPRFINCKGEGRGKVRELLVSNRPLELAQ